MATNTRKKIFLLVFCLASVAQGMYSTYFVSILTTIERIYQIQSKTAGFILSATEIGQIIGSLLIAYYGGRGNKPKWIAACMTLTAVAALISTSPHFLLKTQPLSSPAPIPPSLSSQQTRGSTQPTDTASVSSHMINDPSTESPLQLSSLSAPQPQLTQRLNLPTQEQLCYLNNVDPPNAINSTANIVKLTSPFLVSNNAPHYGRSSSAILVIFFICLLAIGFGSTAITTLGIPFIDDIVSKEESPLYLGLTIGLKIFGPALGFLLGSFCIRLDVNLLTIGTNLDSHSGESHMKIPHHHNTSYSTDVGAWWLGLIIISLPQLILALPLYFLSRRNSSDEISNDFEGITYQAAEDHDIGGSRDFQTHVLTIGDMDVTSNRTCYSDVDSSSREVLQAKSSSKFHYNFGKNIVLDSPIIDYQTMTRESMLKKTAENANENEGGWSTSCVIVNHFGGLESTSFTNDDARSLHSPSSVSFSHHQPPPSSSLSSKQSTINLSNSLSRLLANKLLLLRMLSGTLHILPIAGFYTFLSKYLSEQFRIAPSSASAISGLSGILFVGFGAFAGGMVIRLFNVNSRLMTRWIAISALLFALGMLVLMNLGCPQNQTVYYDISDSSDCSTNCRCSNKNFSPVCANGTTYVSPCLAGCKSYTISEDKIIYDECGCPDKLAANSEPRLNLNVATQGHCLHNCDNLKWYIIIFSIFTLIHSSCEVGGVMFNLRCVKTNDRTLALGLITFASSLLGTIPSSVIYGTVIDLTCIHWDTLSYPDSTNEIHQRGACRAYKNDTFRYYLHGITAFVMFLAFIVDCIISRHAKEVDFYDKNDSREKEGPLCGGSLKKSTETI